MIEIDKYTLVITVEYGADSLLPPGRVESDDVSGIRGKVRGEVLHRQGANQCRIRCAEEICTASQNVSVTADGQLEQQGF